ncbi:PQQ-dependent oxidoreductase, gdhB family [Piscinibacter sakaiensis]|uniref:PQQ-dependent oxidoreductase, gdhB family n=1 Tax=Piscinibacter sakaiensis TaxID=1547922 RepID=A0A0K8NU29_PISS1|nr:PQQ-dependent oxidoreductase, gdhB family [Piscinibacter sakaiensis]
MLAAAAAAAALLGVGGPRAAPAAAEPPRPVPPTALQVDVVAEGLAHPWSLGFLPDGRLLVTERAGRLRVIEPGPDGRPTLRAVPVAGLPPMLVRGQAGLFDVLVDPDFARNGRIFLSYAHGRADANHLRVASARFDGQRLSGLQPLFTSQPAKAGTQHFGGRLLWLPDGTLLLGMGDGNVERTGAQRLDTHLGKLLRIAPDGSVPADNPWRGRPGVRPEIYSLGHRNPQGAALLDGRPYVHEHGARGGDELNRIDAGANYGWPLATGGIDYTYARVTPFRRLPGLRDPLVEWTPSIAPAGMTAYDGALFPHWRGSLFVAALKERSLRRIPMAGGVPGPQEILLHERGERLRDVRAGPDGALYVLTDRPDGAVLRLRPATAKPMPPR